MNKEYFVLFMHGNPGCSEHFQAIESALASKQLECLNFQLPASTVSCTRILEQIKQVLVAHEDKQRVIVAYSWGCYFTVYLLQKLDIHVDKIIFIAPTLIADNPISPLVYGLSRTPALNEKILCKISATQTQKFINNLFAPATPTLQQDQVLSKQLSPWEVWRDAIAYKYKQQKNPLYVSGSPITQKLLILQGDHDPLTQSALQRDLLCSLVKSTQQIHNHNIAEAGHALLWTHHEHIVVFIARQINLVGHFQPTPDNRFGYQAGQSKRNNVLNLLRLNATLFPDRPALRWCTEPNSFDGAINYPFAIDQVTYAEFYQGIERLAQGLLNIGIKQGDRVILFLPMGLAMYTAMFAIMWIGGISVFLDSWARRDHLGACALCVNPKAMISHQQAFELVASVAEFADMPLRIISGVTQSTQYDAHLEDLMATELNAALDLAPVLSEDSALITFTTGSSGTPKGADRTHRFLCAQHQALAKQIPYLGNDIDIPAFPIFSLNNLASGVTTLLPALDLAMPKSTDSDVLASQILTEQVTCTTLSASMMNNLADYCRQHWIKLPSLRRVITGGAPISKDNVRAILAVAPNTQVHILYGSTEVEPMAHIDDQAMLSTPDSDDPEVIEEGVNVGKLVEELAFKIIKPIKGPISLTQQNWEALEVPSHCVGELIVSGDHVCERYYNNEAAFVNSKIQEADGSIWHRTGDLVRYGKDENLYVVGRVHNMIERGKQYIFPVKAEIILKRCDFIKRAAYLGLPDPHWGEKTSIAVEFMANIKQRKKHVAEVLRLFKKNNIPVDAMYQVKQVPMDPRHHSKVEYSQLRKMILAEQAEVLL